MGGGVRLASVTPCIEAMNDATEHNATCSKPGPPPMAQTRVATIIHIYTHTKMQGALRIQKYGSKDSDRVTLFRSASSSFQIRSLIVDILPTIDQFHLDQIV